ncbi:unnamed protein product [Brachionus calyciflorus]|uniref:BZIP domain-containing protein n=1 Tax=Brachionus calyciflorus TaxID=104777 RepID=A0A813TJU3_9BILA|nr:unnamed protein product [Brachionus calyciflorus]
MISTTSNIETNNNNNKSLENHELNNKNLKLNLNLNHSNNNSSNLFKLIKTKSIKNSYISTFEQLNNLNSVSPTNSSISSSSSSNDIGGDQRTMDAADTLVSLAHSASSTPTTEFKPFVQSKSNNFEIVLNTSQNESEIIEKTIKLNDIMPEKESHGLDESNKSKEMVESACKILLEQVLKSCPGVNLSSITIKATAAPSSSTSSIKSPKRNTEEKTNESISKTSLSNSSLNNAKKPRINTKTNDKSPLDKLNFVNSDNSITDSDNDSQVSASNSIRPAPTLATGRRSKDIELPPDESKKRQERRERNKEAAARCRRRRELLTLTLDQKTNDLIQEQENLKKDYRELMSEKAKWEKLFNEHVKNCQSDSQVKKLDEKTTLSKSQKFIQFNDIGQNQTNSSSLALTPISAGFNQIENFANHLESNEKSPQVNNSTSLTRPNNLNLKSTSTSTSNQINNLITPNSASLTSVLQGIAFALGSHPSLSTNSNPNSFSISSNNNISFLMTPTFQLNSPTAFLLPTALTPLEGPLSAFNTCNTPMIIKRNPILAIQNSSNENNQSNTSTSATSISNNNNIVK